MRSSYDVVVVGGGPVGCVAAISAARGGARVLVLEANPAAARRFAGEWIHPTGVQALARLGIGRLGSAAPCMGYGFAVFPDDGTAPVELPFPDGQTGLAAEHSEIVEALRSAARELSTIELLEHARVSRVAQAPGVDAGGEVVFRYQNVEHTVVAGRVIAADGRSGLGRRALGLAPQGQAMSFMASVGLRGVALPVEGYGHVLLGGPGPVLLYRIGDDLVRGCFDVPVSFDQSRRSPAFLWDAFGHVLPPGMRAGFRAALEREPVIWTSTRFAPRASYGKGAVWLAGDAVGHFHPMTAAGLTLGFLDAELAGSEPSLERYQAARERDSYVPELLSNALYHVFSRDDRVPAQIRASVFDTWRGDPSERLRTMRLLTCQVPSRRAFGRSFSRIAARAISSDLGGLLERGLVSRLPGTLAGYREWGRWPAASLVPSRARQKRRVGATSMTPLAVALPTRLASWAATRDLEAGSGPDVPIDERLTIDLEELLQLGSGALLGELRKLHERIGREADFSLLRSATRVIAAIDEAHVGGSMSARMKLAKRPMGRIGMERLLSAHESDPAGVSSCDVASFMISLLSGPEPERIEGLEDGIRHLLACQRADGSFAERPGGPAAPSLLPTELACRALSLCALHSGSGAFRFDVAFARVRRHLLAQQLEDGSFPESELEGRLSNTCFAVRALLAAGLHPTAPELRRATRFVCREQHVSGVWLERADERAEAAQLTARAVLMLLDAPGPWFGVVQRAIVPLAERLRDHHVPALEVGETGAVERTSSLVHALARFAAKQRARPRAAVRMQPSDEDLAFCRSSLEAVSRTFSKPIQMLPGELELAVTCGYLLCRVADTVEDHPAVPLAQKDGLFQQLLAVLEQNASARPFAQAFAEIPGVDAELTLARELPRVMRVFGQLSAPRRAAIARWVAEMARGMSLYTHREKGGDGFVALYTVEDLERYCYYVAGTVGHMLTELFLAELSESEATSEQVLRLRENAEAFGAGLQLVNILKDVTDDRERAWSFVPRAAVVREGLGIAELTDPESRARAHAAVLPLFDLAERSLDRGLEYALAIPPAHKGIRLFCLLPLWMAALTLVHARGNDAMFVEGQQVKISRGAVDRVIGECVALVADDARLRSSYRALWRPSPPLEDHG